MAPERVKGMALNRANLFGQIVGDPEVRTRHGEDTPWRISFLLKTYSRYRNSSNKAENVFDLVSVITDNPEMIQKIKSEKIGANDIVQIKGVVCTADITKTYTCGQCGSIYRLQGTRSYIHPIHIVRYAACVSSDEGYRIVRENEEISNECFLIGALTKKPDYYDGVDENGVKHGGRENSNYKIVVSRSFRVVEDAPDKKNDYPVINTYGEQARSDALVLDKGSYVCVKGSVRVRQIERSVVCPECEARQKVEEMVSEVVASSVDYLRNYNADNLVEAPPEDVSINEDLNGSDNE